MVIRDFLIWICLEMRVGAGWMGRIEKGGWMYTTHTDCLHRLSEAFVHRLLTKNHLTDNVSEIL